MVRIIDLTHVFDQDTIYWPTENGFCHTKEIYGHTDKGFFYASYRLAMAEHGGTHIDAPIHFNEHGKTLEQISLDRLIGIGAVIDVRTACAQNRDYQITVADLLAWEKLNHDVLSNKIVLLMTGYAKHWPDRNKYLGTAELGEQALAKLHFPGLHPDAAHWLAHERHIRAVGIDTASIDYGQTTLYETHRTLFSADIPAFENVTELDQLPPCGAEIIALPIKIKNGSGGPLRIIARVDL